MDEECLPGYFEDKRPVGRIGVPLVQINRKRFIKRLFSSLPLLQSDQDDQKTGD
jgi:hypothetical protein